MYIYIHVYVYIEIMRYIYGYVGGPVPALSARASAMHPLLVPVLWPLQDISG